MTASANLEPLKPLSAALAGIVAAAAPSVVSVRSQRSRSTGFVWRHGLVATASEALSAEGLAGGAAGFPAARAPAGVAKPPARPAARADHAALAALSIAALSSGEGKIVPETGSSQARWS